MRREDRGFGGGGFGEARDQRHGSGGAGGGAVAAAAWRSAGAIDKTQWKFLWLTGFPLFEWSERDKTWVSAQHPFTGIVDEDLEKLESAPWEVRSKGYDLVLNGVELGSGSIRIHRQDIQERLFKALGLTEGTIAEAVWIFPGCADVWHSSAWRNCAGCGSHCDAAVGGKVHSRGDCVWKTTAAQDLMAESPSEEDQSNWIKERIGLINMGIQ